MCVLQKEICDFVNNDKEEADNEIKRLKHDMTAVKYGTIGDRLWSNEDFVAQFIAAALHEVNLADCLLHNEDCIDYLDIDVGELIGSKLTEMAERFLRDFGVADVGKEAAFNSMITVYVFSTNRDGVILHSRFITEGELETSFLPANC